MAFEEVDEIPVIPSVGGWVAKFSGVPLKELIANPDAMVRAQIETQGAVGYDALFSYIDPLYIPEAFGCPLRFLTSGPDVSPLPVRSGRDVENLPVPDIRSGGRLPVILSVTERLARLPQRDLPVLGLVEGPFTTASRILGAERMMRDLIRNRPLVEGMIEKAGELLARFGRALAESGADGLIVADPVSSSTMISPKMYRDVVLPHLKRFIHGLGIPVILHVCGDTRPILGLMAETGAKVLSLDQCMDLVEARNTLAGRCGIGGNVDPIQVLFLGTPETAKKESLKCLKQGGKRGYLLMAGCAIPPGAPIENLKAMVEAARNRS